MSQDDDKTDFIALAWFLLGAIVITGSFLWLMIEITRY